MLLSLPDQSCFSGSSLPSLGGQQSHEAAENSLCNHSLPSSFHSFFFWFYLTDLLKKQRGNTNDMFNTDQLTALQHPKEHKYHIITSPRHRLRTKAQCTSLWLGAVCHGSRRSLLSAQQSLCSRSSPLGDMCSPMMIIQQTLNGHELIQPGGPGDYFTGGRSCLAFIEALWAASLLYTRRMRCEDGHPFQVAWEPFLRGFEQIPLQVSRAIATPLALCWLLQILGRAQPWACQSVTHVLIFLATDSCKEPR